MASSKYHHLIVALLTINTAVALLCVGLVSQPPISTETTVYKTGKNGLNSISTNTVLQQPIYSTVPVPITVPQPIFIQGQKADPCTVKETEGGALVTCPDGSSVFIPNGKDGVDGEDGFSPPKQLIRKNPGTGNIEQQSEGDSVWSLLIKKCEYQGTC